MKKLELQTSVAVMLLALALSAHAQDFPAEKIKLGADLFARHCSPCHGVGMKDPEGAFDLRTFPKDQESRFRNSVGKGKNSMPPWGGLFSADEIESLWAYVMAGEKK